jgi:uncharacterized protein CbrC (UPF0167 family)
MNRSKSFLFAALAAVPFVLSTGCGSGAETADGSAPEADASAAVCACMQEKQSKLTGLLEQPGTESWTAEQWTSALSSEASPCMQAKSSPEEQMEVSKLEKECSGYQAYAEKVKEFSQRLASAKTQEREEGVQNIQELTGGGGARDLLDQLSSKGKQ